MRRLARALLGRLRRGELKNALYLTYFYAYLMLFDRRNGTRFAISHRPEELGTAREGTGNFPAHPRIVKRLLDASGLSLDDPVLDVGHGSGMVLFVASQQGFSSLTGIEHGDAPFDLSVSNLGSRARLIHGDAIAHDISGYRGIFFFSPFRGELAASFFADLPLSIRVVVTMNHDPIIEPLLRSHGFNDDVRYRHPIYVNFRGSVWRRTATSG